MRILVTGGTGFIGRPLCARLLAEGHQLTVLSRHPAGVASLIAPAVTAWDSLDQWQAEDTFDAVINLAGLPIIDAAWTAARKQALWDSRVTLTRQLVAKIRNAVQPPAVFLSGSAIGYYGDCGDRAVDEADPAGQDYGATLCNAWEQAALEASSENTRVCLLRTGLVLHPSGGMLGRMSLPYRLGLGGAIGSGEQWMSWIHRDDHIAIMLRLLHTSTAAGIYNLTAPTPVNNRTFSHELARSFNRPDILTTPAWLLRLILGERAELLLTGQKVLPKRILELGYTFEYPELEAALRGDER